MQLIWCLLSNFYLNMFRSSLCPSSEEQEYALPHMVFCTVSDGCGCVELGRELCAHTLVLLTMGIMMPETCWDKSLIINIRLVASCWSLSLSLSSPYVHDARSQEPKIYRCSLHVQSLHAVLLPNTLQHANCPVQSSPFRLYSPSLLPLLLLTRKQMVLDRMHCNETT
jgi:hypothetical protein